MTQLFDTVAIVGIGHIGSSIARRIKRDKLAKRVVALESKPEHRQQALALGVIDAATGDAAEAIRDADLVIVCTPISAYAEVGAAVAPYLKPGAILSDVGSVKVAAVRDLAPHVPAGRWLVPGHPVAGTEHSGPGAGLVDLFEGRWTILTPTPGTDPAVVEKVASLWRAMGSTIEIMEPAHHDQVLAITSHLPHLIAYTIVGTATDLEKTLQQEVIKFSASGFRDFTRIAASDPTMWRDVFLNNRDAVLEVLGRFNEDLSVLQRAVRNGDGQTLFDLFTRTRAIRRAIVDLGQDTAAPNFGRNKS
jgi:cyclohexadieny/prephenate dehydrogenase